MPGGEIRRITAWVAVVAVAVGAGHVSQALTQNDTSSDANPFSQAQNETSSDANPFSQAQNETSPLPALTNNATESLANPFSQNADADGSKICCCQVSNSSSYSAFQYQDPATAPSECCCGEPGQECPDLCASSNFTSVCGSGQVCGILLLMAALVGTLAITICITGVFLARRRRQRNATDQFLTSFSQSGRATVQQANIVRIPDEQLKDLLIKDVDMDENRGSADPQAEVDEEQGGVRQVECPICLEPVEHQVVSEFPCGHTCCRGCRDDLVHHSSRVVNASTVAILCPLCRKLAVAPSPVNESRRSRQQVILVQALVDEGQVEAETTAPPSNEQGDGPSETQDASETIPTVREDGSNDPVPRST